MSVDLYAIKIIIERVDNNHDVTKFRIDDTTSEVPVVIRPYDMNLIVAQVTQLNW